MKTNAKQLHNKTAQFLSKTEDGYIANQSFDAIIFAGKQRIHFRVKENEQVKSRSLTEATAKLFYKKMRDIDAPYAASLEVYRGILIDSGIGKVRAYALWLWLLIKGE